MIVIVLPSLQASAQMSCFCFMVFFFKNMIGKVSPLLHFLFLRQSLALVLQAGVHWRDLGSLRSLCLPDSSDFSHLIPQSGWDYRRLPPCPATFCAFSRDGVSQCWPGWS